MHPISGSVLAYTFWAAFEDDTKKVSNFNVIKSWDDFFMVTFKFSDGNLEETKSILQEPVAIRCIPV